MSTAGGVKASAVGVALALCLVAAVVTGTHWPVLWAQALSLDDNAFVTNNPLVRNPGWESAGRFLAEVLNPSTVRGYYLPLSMISLMVDYAMGGRPDDLRVFHRTHLALHAANSALLVLVLYGLLRRLAPAVAAALLFGLHPLTVEPVAWIGERKTLLATFFALGCVVCHLRHARAAGTRWLIASVFLYALALLSKPTVVTLPLGLLVLDRWPLGRLGRRAIVEKWPMYLLAAASATVTLVSHRRTAGIVKSTAADYLQLPVEACYAIGFYFRKIVWPATLSCVYPVPEPLTLNHAAVWPAVLLVSSGLCLLLMLRRRAPALLYSALVFALLLAPTLGVVKYSWVRLSDKYLYLPALGLALLAGWAIQRLLRSSPATTLSRLVVVVPLLMLLAAEVAGTRRALRPWRDTLTLYQHMHEVAPDSPPVLSQLAILLHGQARFEEAERHLRRAVEVMPDYGEARYNLGLALAGRGRIDEAVHQFREATRWLPGDADAQFNLAMALISRARYAEAVPHLESAVEFAPASVRSINALAWVRATCPDPSLRDGRRAVELAERAAELTGRRSAEALDTLAAAYARAGRFEEAVATARAALDLAAERGPTAFREELQRRAALYELREAYTDATPSPAQQ